ncbi:P-loop containing nucleoside triphosphate hydrolase protein [Scenedesmus sp. NREL 46B-D3]|nr:P-loop containing nucleoside triphosphate hydrolase protein [Scenedesmus sp. NREL 46B-D3]
MLPDVPCRTWLYPAMPPPREYQFHIAWTATLHNTLACLPTGLGKTLIAAVVMYNFYRWFPMGKVVFITPTRPLVEQQFQACKAFMGIHKVRGLPAGPAAATCIKRLHVDALLTSSGPLDRMEDWANHRMFFTTPQCLQNDLKKGTCPAHQLVCLVVDECHRATGDAAMAKSLQLLRERRARFRVLGLSATPGNSHDKIKAVVQNLMISRIEFRDDADADVAKHCHVRTREQRLVPVCQEGRLIRQLLRKLMTPLAMRLNSEAEVRAPPRLPHGVVTQSCYYYDQQDLLVVGRLAPAAACVFVVGILCTIAHA